MAVPAVQRSKRALVSLLKKLASKRSLDLDVNRDSGDAVVRKSYRTLSGSVHPDRGGSADDQTKLNVAYNIWEKDARATEPRGSHRLAKQRALPGSNLFCALRRHTISLRQNSMPFAMCAGRLRERRVLHQGHDS